MYIPLYWEICVLITHSCISESECEDEMERVNCLTKLCVGYSYL